MSKFIIRTIDSDDDLPNSKGKQGSNLTQKKRKVEMSRTTPEEGPISPPPSPLTDNEEDQLEIEEEFVDQRTLRPVDPFGEDETSSEEDFSEDELEDVLFDDTTPLNSRLSKGVKKKGNQKAENQDIVENSSSSDSQDHDDSEDDDKSEEDAEDLSGPGEGSASDNDSEDNIEEDQETKDEIIPLATNTKKKVAVEQAPISSKTAKKVDFSKFDPGLSRAVLKALDRMGILHPTPIQVDSLPFTLKDRDVCGCAVTGSGKTLAFLIPVLEKILRNRGTHQSGKRGCLALILEPTRELATQAYEVLNRLTKFTNVTSVLLIGGLPLKTQEAQLRQNPDIVVGTPGRVIDHLRNSATFGLENLESFVLDEADRLLDIGFGPEIHQILLTIHRQTRNQAHDQTLAHNARVQTLLFSATLNEQVTQLGSLALNRPVVVRTDAVRVSEGLSQEVVKVAKEELKEPTLLYLLKTTLNKAHTLVFVPTKTHTHRLYHILHNLLPERTVLALHAGLSTSARQTALRTFADSETAILVATDVAARGLDFLHAADEVDLDSEKNNSEEVPKVAGFPVTAVVMFGVWGGHSAWVHRAGRTARQGKKGRLFALCNSKSDSREWKEAKSILKTLGGAVAERRVDRDGVSVCKEEIAHFEEKLSEILAEERVETELRRAEQQVQKGINMELYSEQILSRPKRTWFTTEEEKKKLKEKMKQQMFGGAPEAKPTSASSPAKKDKGPKSKKEQFKEQRTQLAKRREAKERKHDALEQTVHAKAFKKQHRARQQLRENLPAYMEDDFDHPKRQKSEKKPPPNKSSNKKPYEGKAAKPSASAGKKLGLTKKKGQNRTKKR